MGRFRCRDGNESEYLADFAPVQKKFYPYRDAVSVLYGWFATHPEERALQDKLTILGLSPAIKAEKDSELAEKLAAVVDIHVETELKIGRRSQREQKSIDEMEFGSYSTFRWQEPTPQDCEVDLNPP